MYILDATPLIYLGKTDSLEVLDATRQRNITTPGVYREVVEEGKKRGAPEANRLANYSELEITESIPRQNQLYQRLETNDRLSEADIEVLVLADKEQAIAVMDEAYGRKVAMAEDIEVRGTAYLVLMAVKHGEITAEQARDTIDRMIDSGWYCSTNLYSRITKKLNELEQ